MEEKMMQWEYHVEELGRKDIKAWKVELDLLGKQGWELVLVLENVAFLKRQVDQSTAK
jgi:hypothetical protein